MPQLDTYMYVLQIFIYKVIMHKYFRFIFSLTFSVVIGNFQVSCADNPWEDEEDLRFFNEFVSIRKVKPVNASATNTVQVINYLTSEDISFKITKVQQSGVGNCTEIANFFSLADNQEFLQRKRFPRGIVFLEEEFEDGSELIVSPIECLDKLVSSHLPHEALVHIKNMAMNRARLRDDELNRCWFSLRYNDTHRLSLDESNEILRECNEDYKTKILLGSEEVHITKNLYSKLTNKKL